MLCLQNGEKKSSRQGFGLMILSGDIGGTNTRLALFETEGAYKKVSDAHFHSRDYPGLFSIVEEYLKQEKQKISRACFAVAGPVHDGRCKLTNLSWSVDVRELQQQMKIPVLLINDLEANGWGLRVLEPEDFALLQRGNPRQVGNAALVSAGTGLGEAGLYWDGKKLNPFPCEGGHSDFAARNPLESELLLFLQKMHGAHVSYERVVSGPGLLSLYEFLTQSGHEKESAAVQEEIKKKDPSTVVSEWGRLKKDRACSRALDWFLSLYGAEAGNVALKFLALGGIFLGGGIAPKLVDRMKEGKFLEAFLDKGRFRKLLETIPIRIVLNDETALLGTAVYVRTKRY